MEMLRKAGIDDEADDDMKPGRHVAKSLKVGEDECSPQDSFQRTDVVGTSDVALAKSARTVSQAKSISDEAHACIAMMTARLCTPFDTDMEKLTASMRR